MNDTGGTKRRHCLDGKRLAIGSKLNMSYVLGLAVLMEWCGCALLFIVCSTEEEERKRR